MTATIPQLSALVPSVSVDALVLRRNAIVERLKDAHQALQQVAELSEAAFGEDHCRYRTLHLQDTSTHISFTDPSSLPAFVRKIDASGWSYLLDQSGIKTFMSAKVRKEWDEAIYELKVPELTAENIWGTFQVLYDKRGEMFEEGVIEVFRSLSWHYKTNRPVKFGKRLVMNYMLEGWYRGGFGSVSFGGANKLDDLIRVLCVLDGKPEPDHRQGAYRLLNAAKWPAEARDVELHGVVSVRGFKNQNAHVTFLRPDLVERMNQILAKHYPMALPPVAP